MLTGVAGGREGRFTPGWVVLFVLTAALFLLRVSSYRQCVCEVEDALPAALCYIELLILAVLCAILADGDHHAPALLFAISAVGEGRRADLVILV